MSFAAHSVLNFYQSTGVVLGFLSSLDLRGMMLRRLYVIGY